MVCMKKVTSLTTSHIIYDWVWKVNSIHTSPADMMAILSLMNGEEDEEVVISLNLQFKLKLN